MITIQDTVTKQQPNFWNNCIFHPTDAVEDPWGKRILDRMAEDKSIQTVRIYAMLEDIVYTDSDEKLAYDFRLNDLRLDYLVGKGYNILIAYAFMPECLASDKKSLSCVSKNKTRYKGKLINTSVPADYTLWEDVCFEYTKHLVERYGLETVSGWHLHCWNEPDIQPFFISDKPESEIEIRLTAYCKLYEAFVKGILKVSEKLCIGGPALAYKTEFMKGFLGYVKEKNLRLDYIALHNYARTGPDDLNTGKKNLNVDNWLSVMETYLEVMKTCGFADTEIVVDEWGMASNGFFNIEECPAFIARETEVFSAYFVKLICKMIEKQYNVSKLMICLSGQHEMVTDFSGFRNFFTLNFFAKPIYNAYLLASKLYNGLVQVRTDDRNIYVIPTKNEGGQYAVLLTYSSDHFEEDLPEIKQELVFDAGISGKTVCIYRIDRNTANPYRLYEKKGLCELSENSIKELREEGNIKPLRRFTAENTIEMDLTANAVYLITVS